MTKQSEAAKTFFIGHETLVRSRGGTHYGEAGRRNLGLFQSKDDPVRHERLAAIGKNGTQIRLHKKDDVLFREPFCLENEVH